MKRNEVLEYTKNKILEKFNLNTIHGIFVYGSAVYLNKDPSDIDVILVLDGNISKDYHIDDLEIHIITLGEFSKKLQDHDVVIMECIINEKIIFTDEIKTVLDSFVLEPSILRTSFSKTSSNSYVKAKKKLIIPETYDRYCSMKSLWHSFRILQFGIQIIYHYKSRSDFNWEVSNSFWDSIQTDYISFENLETSTQWKNLNSKYRPIINSLNTEFRKIAPKN